MPYEIRLKRSAENELESLPSKVHDRIVASLLSLKSNPHPRGSIKLQGREGYRIMVGDYRVLYAVDAEKMARHIPSPTEGKHTAYSRMQSPS